MKGEKMKTQKTDLLKIGILLLGISAIVVALVLVGCMQKLEEPTPTLTVQPAKELKLSDFPEVFKENTLIVIGDNAYEVELQAANEVAGYLENETGNKPIVKKYSEIKGKDKRNYNLIIIGTPNSNPMLKEVYEMANVSEVNETFPGEEKGILEILRNLWNKNRAILLIEGSKKEGVRGDILFLKSKNEEYFDKLVEELEKVPPGEPMKEYPLLDCDFDHDWDCDRNDLELFQESIGSCHGDTSYNPIADADGSGCIDSLDENYLFPDIKIIENIEIHKVNEQKKVPKKVIIHYRSVEK
jgi:hypothetical protein